MDSSTQEDFSHQRLRQEHLQMAAAFNKKALELGCGDLSDYFWYHTIDLGDGLITPGTYDYRFNLDPFHFPENMTGMRVLDVGSGTGFLHSSSKDEAPRSLLSICLRWPAWTAFQEKRLSRQFARLRG